jgi:hypothetical protein
MLDGMGGTCSADEVNTKYVREFNRKTSREENVDGRMILKRITEKRSSIEPEIAQSV